MEELHSTAALDEEIKADARKKAERILSKSDVDCKALLDGVDARLATAEKNATDASHTRTSLYEKNINASLPLEKQRYLVSYIHNAVVDQINEYLSSLSEQQKIEIVKTLAQKAKSKLAGRKVDAHVINLDVNKANEMLKEVFGGDVKSCVKTDPIELADDELKGIDKHEGILLKTDDGKITCRFTIDEKIQELLDTKSYELSTTLFGGRLPQ